MDVSLLHPTQLRALLEGHRNGLFRDYGAHIKPIKLCLGLVPLGPGELVASSSSPSTATVEGSRMRWWVHEDKVDVGSCFRFAREEGEGGEGEGIIGFDSDLIGERLEVDKHVGEWLGKVVARIPPEDLEYSQDDEKLDKELYYYTNQAILRHNPSPLTLRKYTEQLPLLSKMSQDEKAEWTDGKRHGWLSGDEDIDTLRCLPLRLPAVRIAKYPGGLQKLQEPFKRSKEEKEADGEDGGVRWSRKVRKDIGDWVKEETVGERLRGDEGVVRWMMEVVKREVNVNVEEDMRGVDEGEGKNKVKKEKSAQGQEEEEVLFPLELGKTEKVAVEMEWPLGKKEMEGMRSLVADGSESYEKDLLGEFRGGYILENLVDDGNIDTSIVGISTPKATSLHIPSSPPLYHLIPQSSIPGPSSQLSSMGKKRSNEELYIEGPLTPLPSSPFPFHHDNPKSVKKPRQQMKISLPPPDPTPSSQRSAQEKTQSIPSNMISEGKFFMASIAQEQLSAEDGQLREEVPVMDIDLEKMRLAAPWDGIDVLISDKGGVEMPVDNDWLGLAGAQWAGEKVIMLELSWRPLNKKTWGIELLKEVIGGEDDYGEGGGILEEVERLGEIGRKVEEDLSVGYGDLEGSKKEDDEEEDDLEVVIGKFEMIEVNNVNAHVLGKRKRQESGVEGKNHQYDAPNQKDNSNEAQASKPVQLRPLQQNKNYQAVVSLQNDECLSSERAACISHNAKSIEPQTRPSLDTRTHASTKGTLFAPIFKPLSAPFSATASLAAFMAIRDRASLIPSTITNPHPQTPLPKSPPPSAIPHPSPSPPEKSMPSPSLPKILPKAQFVLSTNLLQSQRGILRALKKLWGKNVDWIEREYTPTSQSRPLNLSEGQNLDTNLLDFNDEYTHTPPLLLSPAAGMYFTSLQDIREHVFLPGEKEFLHPNATRGGGVSGVRESITHIAKTVDTLWVIVVAPGELSSGRDSLHWSSFVGFCASIGECRVVPVLVASGLGFGGTGGEEVLSRYVTKIMLIEVERWGEVVESVAPWWIDDYDDSENQRDTDPTSAEDVEEHTNGNTWLLPTPTTGEKFLRKAGINVFAAGVILRELSRLESDSDYYYGHGDGGGKLSDGLLRRLFTMGSLSREKLFRELVGEKVVRRLEGIVEGVWGGEEFGEG